MNSPKKESIHNKLFLRKYRRNTNGTIFAITMIALLMLVPISSMNFAISPVSVNANHEAVAQEITEQESSSAPQQEEQLQQPMTEGDNTSSQQSTTYNFAEVTFEGSHIKQTAAGLTLTASTSGSFHPISSLVGGSQKFTTQVEGTGAIKWTITEKRTEGDCVYEFEGKYEIVGKVTYDSFTLEQIPKGRLYIDIENQEPSGEIYPPLKNGPQICSDTFSSAFDPMLICDEERDINIATGQLKNERHDPSKNEHEVCVLELSGNSTPSSNSQCTTFAAKTYNGYPWKFNYEVALGKGLVLNDITAGAQHLYDSISAPHFKIEFANGKSKIIRYCDLEDPNSYTKFEARAPLINNNFPTNDKTTLSWGFNRGFVTEEDGVRGNLRIFFEVVISNIESNNCEGLEFECYWFIPKVTYRWSGEPGSEISRFTAYYKLDYGPSAGLVRVKDGDGAGALKNPGYQSFVTNEVGFLAVRNGQAGEYDNIHTIYSPGGTVFIPGCQFGTEFSCPHIHWRWSDFEYGPRGPLDPMVEPSTGQPILDKKRGTPHLVPGQTIAIAIVKHNAGEEDPDDISSLLSNEQVATALTINVQDDFNKQIYRCADCALTKSEHPVVWYVASVPNKNSDTFFRHGMFVLDTKWGDVHTHGIVAETNSTIPSTTPAPQPTLVP